MTDGVERGSTVRSEHPTPDESTGLALWQVTNQWQAAQRRAFAPLGLTHVQFVLLATLTAAGTPMKQRDLARSAHTDAMMTSQVVRALADRGLVQRDAHPDDARAVAVAVTAGGVAAVNEANRVVEATDRDFFAPLGTERLPFTRRLLTLRR